MTAEHKPTEEQRAEVQRLSGVGISQLQVAILLDIDVKTLTKHYREDIDIGIAKSDSILAGALYRKAIEGDDLGAMIWLSKVRLRWKPPEEATPIADSSNTVINFNVTTVKKDET